MKNQTKIVLAAGICAIGCIFGYLFDRYKDYIKNHDKDVIYKVVYDHTPRNSERSGLEGIIKNNDDEFINRLREVDHKAVDNKKDSFGERYLFSNGKVLTALLTSEEEFLRASLDNRCYGLAATISSDLGIDEKKIGALLEKSNESDMRYLLDMRVLMFKKNTQLVDFKDLDPPRIKKIFRQQIVANLCYAINEIKGMKGSEVVERYGDTYNQIFPKMKKKYQDLKRKYPNVFSKTEWEIYDDFIGKRLYFKEIPEKS